MTEGDLAGLTAVWRARWDGSPVGCELRERFADRWVRFHSLPESKRYAETEAEYGVVLDRHRTLLRALGVEDRLCLIAGYFDGAEGPSSPHPDHPGPGPPGPGPPGPGPPRPRTTQAPDHPAPDHPGPGPPGPGPPGPGPPRPRTTRVRTTQARITQAQTTRARSRG